MARAELEKVLASEDVTDMEYLALFVLKERTNPNSAWRPYLGALSLLLPRCRSYVFAARL